MAAVALIDLRSLNNVGNIARTAMAFGISELITVGTTPPLSRPEIKKTSLGGEKISTKHFSNLSIMLKQTTKYQVVALEIGGTPLDKVKRSNLTNPLFLLGNERFGLTKEQLKACSQIISISHQTKTIKSLNVTNAFAIVAWWLYT